MDAGGGGGGSTGSAGSSLSGKAHAVDPVTEANEREARIQARRQRIEVRNASKDDESRRKSQQVGEARKLGRGKQQVADSLNQLDRRKIAGIRHVTSVRVEADDAENRRRVEEEERRHARVAKLQQEALESGAKNAAVEMRWADLFEYSMPQELHRELEAQNRACNEILASKDAVIREFQRQLKAKDEEYVIALKTQAEDIEKLLDRMGQQYREMQDEYENELEQMEDAFLKERDELIATNKLEIDSLFERRREMEMVYMETKQQRDEQYLKEIEDLRVRDAEDYNALKIKLETNIQTLEQQLEEMRATYQLNTEKLEYNYRVLTERDMENSATLSQQKRKLARLKDALAALITKYNQTDARDRQQNQELTEEYRRLTKQYKDLQKKYAHFESSDQSKYEEVRKMHEDEAMSKLEKLLAADKTIHEQQLGLTWRPPPQPVRTWTQSGSGGGKARAESPHRIGAGSTDKKSADAHDAGNNVGEDEYADFDSMSVKKISSSKLKYMLKLLASEAGFLVNTHVQKAIENMPDDEAELVKADMIMRALGIENEDEMERLMRFFFQDPRAEVSGDSPSTGKATGKGSTAPTPAWGIMVGPEDVIRVIKQFVEEVNEQKRSAPISRMLRRTSATALAGESSAEGGPRSVSGGGTSGKQPGSEAASLSARTAEAKKSEKAYWETLLRLFPERKLRVLRTLETGLTQYHGVLLRRKEILDDVDSLTAQNAELKEMLKQYLGAPINEDLIIPPTQMQLYTTDGGR